MVLLSSMRLYNHEVVSLCFGFSFEYLERNKVVWFCIVWSRRFHCVLYGAL